MPRTANTSGTRPPVSPGDPTSGWADANVDAIRLRKKQRRPSQTSNETVAGTAADDRSQVSSSLPGTIEAFGHQIDLLKREGSIRSRKNPAIATRDECGFECWQAGIRNRNGIVDGSSRAAAMIEEPERCVAALLDLGDHDPRPDRVDRSGRDRKTVSPAHNSAHDEVEIEPPHLNPWREAFHAGSGAV